MGKLAKSIMSGTGAAEGQPLRNDLLFMPYKGMTIRYIIIRRVDFGTPINDTTRSFKNKLTEWADYLHHNTRETVIRKNLFFHSGEKLQPYLLADNERHLRDLSYLQDAKISVEPVKGSMDMVDILVQTKDVLSLGGAFRMHSSTRMSMMVSEDNFAGWGHALQLRGFYDQSRMPRGGYGGEYIYRNIAGSFIDWNAGYLNFNKNFNTGTQNEEMWFARFIRPLVNPYMKFIYAGEVAYHNTGDMYKKDSAYDYAHKYRYYNYDTWIGWNTGPFKVFGGNENNRLRTLVGARWIQQSFSEVPDKYLHSYYYAYADLRAALASVSVFSMDFYKTKYVYGFGRNEDIPEGVDLSLTAGWTKKSGVERPYVGIDLQRFFFSARESYFSYAARAGGFLNHGQMEDINLLFNLDYFSRLIHCGTWNQRSFVDFGLARQEKTRLNEPLFLQSDFGLREWRADTITTGNTRATLKAESVFYAPWSFANFRFAPFVFGNLSYFGLDPDKKGSAHLYSSAGGGLRIRNESLIFETIELRTFYFPEKNFRNERWRFEFNTGIRFKYNKEQIKRPDFVIVN